jgi:hypothetical protein
MGSATFRVYVASDAMGSATFRVYVANDAMGLATFRVYVANDAMGSARPVSNTASDPTSQYWHGFGFAHVVARSVTCSFAR